MNLITSFCEKDLYVSAFILAALHNYRNAYISAQNYSKVENLNPLVPNYSCTKQPIIVPKSKQLISMNNFPYNLCALHYMDVINMCWKVLTTAIVTTPPRYLVWFYNATHAMS